MLDSGLGGNVGVCLGADGIFLIDDQFERTAPQLIEALKRLSDDPVAFLINTHFHEEATGGTTALVKAGGPRTPAGGYGPFPSTVANGTTYHLLCRSRRIAATIRMIADEYMMIRWNQQNRHGSQ